MPIPISRLPISLLAGRKTFDKLDEKLLISYVILSLEV